MKDKANQIDILRSIRKTWGFKPTTRVVKDKTKYQRNNKHRNSFH